MSAAISPVAAAAASAPSELADLTRSVISGNSAGSEGGGISMSTTIIYGTATLTRCTVSGNSAGGSGGGIRASFANLDQ